MEQKYNVPPLVLGGIGAVKLLFAAFSVPFITDIQVDAIVNLVGFGFILYATFSHPKKPLPPKEDV